MRVTDDRTPRSGRPGDSEGRRNRGSGGKRRFEGRSDGSRGGSGSDKGSSWGGNRSKHGSDRRRDDRDGRKWSERGESGDGRPRRNADDIRKGGAGRDGGQGRDGWKENSGRGRRDGSGRRGRDGDARRDERRGDDRRRAVGNSRDGKPRDDRRGGTARGGNDGFERGPRQDRRGSGRGQRGDGRGDGRGGRRDDGRGFGRGGSRDDGRSEGNGYGRPRSVPGKDERELEEVEHLHPGLEAAADEPDVPDVDESSLPVPAAAELKSLPKDLASTVAKYLVAAGQALDEDPELAFKYAEAARRRAARLPVVREAAAETAYAAGIYTVALREFRALKRMTGNPGYTPVIADCERALGRPRNALQYAAEAKGLRLDDEVELILVTAGARLDLGQASEARRLLEETIRKATSKVPAHARVRLYYAYADLVEDTDPARAAKFFEKAAELDPEHQLDADDRALKLQGMSIEVDDSEPDETLEIPNEGAEQVSLGEDSGAGGPETRGEDESLKPDSATDELDSKLAEPNLKSTEDTQ